MGTGKKLKKKFEKPGHPWERARIEKERILRENYGIRRKSEIWKMSSMLKNFKRQAKKLIAMTGVQTEREKQQLISKLNRLGLIEKDATMDSILSITLENLMDRRLQSKIFLMGLARTSKQARQLVIHGHINVNDAVIDSPSYLVKVGDKISYTKASKFNNPEHPERVKEKKGEVKKEKKEILKKREPKKEIKEPSKEISEKKTEEKINEKKSK